MRSVLWSVSASNDYLDILRHIAADDPDAAEKVAEAVWTTGNNLADFATGHSGRVPGTYEKSVHGLPHIIAYALTDDDRNVLILRVIHAARDWRDKSWPG